MLPPWGYLLTLICFSCSGQQYVEQKEIQVELKCGIVSEGEYGVPVSQVYVVIDGQEQKVGPSQTCDIIEKEYYSSFDIPEAAITACGRWWAGSGDYYYLIFENGEHKVYYRVLDEMVDPIESEWVEVFTR